MKNKGRTSLTLAAVALATVGLTGCGGIEGRIGDYDRVSVWEKADPKGQQPIASLTIQTPVTVECYVPGKVDAQGMGYGGSYKVSYDGGSGYIDDSTSIMSDGGEVSPERVPEC